MSDNGSTRRHFIKTLVAGSAALALPAGAQPGSRNDPERPNVVLIMTDDQGYGDLGITGNPIIRTPHIDSLARRSAWMENFYVHPVCSPTRACLMTGRYNHRTRCIDTYVGRSMMDPGEVTVAEILRDAGYATGIFGKWHLGDNFPMRPKDQGFDESLVHRGGGIGQPGDPPGGEGKYTDPILFHNGKEKPCSGYCTDIYFSEAMRWIGKCHASKQSFFAYIPTNAPHGPFHDVPEELYQSYKKTDLDNSRFPQDTGHKLPAKCNSDKRARIFSMITNVDENVGRLQEKLDSLGLSDNTIVIFMTDNGPNARRYVAGMKGMKSHVHEGGIRSPFFVQWPARIEAGRRSDRIAAHIDVLPTILDACGVTKPAGLKLDGRSLMPLLEGRKTEWPDRLLVIQSHRGDVPVLHHHFAARNQRWKLLHASGFGRESFEGEPEFELYDMAGDPLEMKNLAAEQPDMVKAMREAYEVWFRDVSATRADNYAPPRIVVGTKNENPSVLTRQNWRHYMGRPWARDSNGYWQIEVGAAGLYDIELSFPEIAEDGMARIKIAGRENVLFLKKGARRTLFESLRLPAGFTRLKAFVEVGGTVKGPLFAIVTRRE